MQRTAQNSLVILAALGAALAVVQTQTNWLDDAATKQVERERCFGVTREAANDCATPKHSCAAQSKTARDAEEWIMVPGGLCDKLAGGRAETL
jgi:uncharacterized membrane protein